MIKEIEFALIIYICDVPDICGNKYNKQNIQCFLENKLSIPVNVLHVDIDANGVLNIKIQAKNRIISIYKEM